MSTCPRCGAAIAPTSMFCGQCGWRQAEIASPATVADGPTTVPLTAEQRMWLRMNTVLPVVTLPIGLGLLFLIWSCFFAQFVSFLPVRIIGIILGLMMVAGLVVTVFHVGANLADMLRGTGQVQIARALSKHSTSHSPRTFYVEFEQIGSLTMLGAIYDPVVEGSLYRVTYSPRTKRCWSAEPI